MKLLLLVISLSIVGAFNASLANGLGTLVTIGQWTSKNDKPRIEITLTEFLSKKQKSIVNGGFTTISNLILRMKDPTSGKTNIVYKVRCSVKFDAWEETYDIAKLDISPNSRVVKDFNEYADLCLNPEIVSSNLISQLAPSGGTLIASLIVKQTSAEEAKKIKSWLIEQQSGVMAGLFSHMLGELSLHQATEVKVSVPAKPDVLGKIPSVLNKKQKKDKG